MKRTFCLAPVMLALAAASPAPTPRADPLEQTLIAMEKQSWVAWQAHDSKFWESFLSDDHVELNAFIGMTGKKEVIEGIADGACTVLDYTVNHFSFRRFDSKTAMLVYRAAQNTRCGKFVVPSPVWATSLFQKRGGRWVNILYGHTPIPPPPPARAAGS